MYLRKWCMKTLKSTIIHSTYFVITVLAFVDLDGLWSRYCNPNELWLFTVNCNWTDILVESAEWQILKQNQSIMPICCRISVYGHLYRNKEFIHYWMVTIFKWDIVHRFLLNLNTNCFLNMHEVGVSNSTKHCDDDAKLHWLLEM
jgi:hypothetical protein